MTQKEKCDGEKEPHSPTERERKTGELLERGVRLRSKQKQGRRGRYHQGITGRLRFFSKRERGAVHLVTHHKRTKVYVQREREERIGGCKKKRWTVGVEEVRKKTKDMNVPE